MNLDRQQLNQWQHQLAEVIFQLSRTPLEQEAGLNIYRSNRLMSAARSLSVSYPVLSKMIGEEMLLPLAARLLVKESPNRGDWAEWGRGLAKILEHSELHQELPFLAEMARFEWQRHCISRASVDEISLTSLDLLNTHSLDEIFLRFNGALTLLRSDFAVDELWYLHRVNEADYMPTSSMIKQTLMAAKPMYLVLYQQQHELRQERVSQVDFLAMQTAQAGSNLGLLVEQYAEFDFIHWLSRALNSGWITALSLEP